MSRGEASSNSSIDETHLRKQAKSGARSGHGSKKPIQRSTNKMGSFEQETLKQRKPAISQTSFVTLCNQQSLLPSNNGKGQHRLVAS